MPSLFPSAPPRSLHPCLVTSSCVFRRAFPLTFTSLLCFLHSAFSVFPPLWFLPFFSPPVYVFWIQPLARLVCFDGFLSTFTLPLEKEKNNPRVSVRSGFFSRIPALSVSNTDGTSGGRNPTLISQVFSHQVLDRGVRRGGQQVQRSGEQPGEFAVIIGEMRKVSA